MKAPIGKFVMTLNAVPSKFVRTVKAVADQKQAQAA
jgi:large subunit ribosomal protein L10